MVVQLLASQKPIDLIVNKILHILLVEHFQILVHLSALNLLITHWTFSFGLWQTQAKF